MYTGIYFELESQQYYYENFLPLSTVSVMTLAEVIPK
jgi:hypothetical protein